MPRKRSTKTPPEPTWKTLIAGLAVAGTVTILIWGLRSIAPGNPSSGNLLPLTILDFIPGSGFFLIPLLTRLTSQIRKKHPLWCNWLLSLIALVYIDAFLLWAAIALLTKSLNRPWNWVLNGILVVFVILVWAMPLLSHPTAKKLSQIPWSLSGPMMGLLGIAGILGASFGMYGHRRGETNLVFGVMAFLCLFLAFLIAAGSAQDLWDSRPWAKEEE